MSETLEKATKQLVEALETIDHETRFVGCYISCGPYHNNEFKDFHLSNEEFNKLFGDRIVCIEERNSTEYPYQKYVILCGCKFFCLLESLEEPRAA